jgi:uncharacterized membrane protein YesL
VAVSAPTSRSVPGDASVPGDPSEPGPLPAAPRLGGSARAAAADLYFNSWRLVPMNLVWGVLLLLILAVAGLWSVVALAALPILALPLAGMARLSALIVRGRGLGLGDGFAAWRRYLVPALGLGVGICGAASVLAVNVLIGLRDGGLVTVAIATLAGWGLVLVAAFTVAAWPLLVDPEREADPVRERLRLAGLLVVAHPGRMLGLTAVVVAFLALSTLAFAALLTVSIALATQISARYVLPAADRLEARLATARAARTQRG